MGFVGVLEEAAEAGIE
jgi:hypothetical protein